MTASCWLPCGNHVGALGAALFLAADVAAGVLLSAWFRR